MVDGTRLYNSNKVDNANQSRPGPVAVPIQRGQLMNEGDKTKIHSEKFQLPLLKKILNDPNEEDSASRRININQSNLNETPFGYDKMYTYNQSMIKTLDKKQDMSKELQSG